MTSVVKKGALILAGVFLALIAASFIVGLIRDITEKPSEFFSDPTTLALAEALIANDGARVEALIADGASLQAQGIDGVTLLQWRILRGDIGRFKWLLDLGADPDAQGWHGETAMHLAAQHQNIGYLKAALDHNGNPNVLNTRRGRTPLFNAMDTRRQENVELLLERGADIHFADRSGTQPLLHAARIINSDAVVLLLKMGADPNATDQSGANFQRSFFRTDPALMNSKALRHRAWVVSFLKERGIRVADPHLN